ncbi:MAG: protease inhibitor I42 family protein [Pyrinomonadaceae bacterium]
MTKQLDERADGQEIELAVGTEFELTLDENASTGFRWQTVASGAPACQLVKDDFQAPTNDRPGQPGRHVWQFRAVQAGASKIELTYSRAGRERATTGRTFTLRVRVTK